MATMIRWNPVREMMAMQNAFDRVWNDANRTATTALSLNVFESDTAYTVFAALPGTTTDNIQISLHDGVLTIAGEVPANTVENARVLIMERSAGNFSRSLRLPHDIDMAKVEATFENGVLTLTLPKAEEAQPRMIPVRTSGTHNQN
jgi:HSP20 family protein